MGWIYYKVPKKSIRIVILGELESMDKTLPGHAEITQKQFR